MNPPCPISNGVPVPKQNDSMDKTYQENPRSQDDLNVRDQLQSADFYAAVAKILEFRTTYLQEKRIFLEGEALIPVLRGLGATQDSFEHMRLVSDHLGKDPTVDYRTIGLGRFALDREKSQAMRLEDQLFALTEEENYKRHDSGVARDFPPLGSEFQHNTVIQALMVFKSIMMEGFPLDQRQGLDYASNSWICNVFNVRTFTDKDIQGHPALEGVHQDGGDHTMTVFLHSENLRQDSGITSVHDNNETTGISGYEAKPGFIIDRVQHRHYLDTLMFADNSYKHSVTPVYISPGEDRAVRDMLVLITRKPKLPGHPTKIMDSMEANRLLPLRFPLWLPGISHIPIAPM
ncbi:Protein of unknown function DUF2257 [Penicillium cf. griseofulvum]|uniref:Uncharacterized protein n=1 Tax=Penicillium cf. griseofulvum TaxID=2972120 RepID=A0A9W9MZY1_9EURO|nr:Protein of unknown function DUF2257 [Penicillium cf. griseofulvum]KAJ5422033.1 Protein of unknown function DUF2257 [Penicillium cf. griseofulvum]KAJ5428223.1 Protein of unknown function DUF2257 [Penicillium cf. griseofulvum]